MPGDMTASRARFLFRHPLRLSASAALAVILAATSFLSADVAGAATTAPELGVITPTGPFNMADLDAFEAAAGGQADIYSYYQEWAYNSFDPAVNNAIVARGMTPEIVWDPWDWVKGPNQPEYSLASIISGSHDDYIKSWARAVRMWKKPLRIRLMTEMNSPNFAWGVTVNGNTPAQFIAAWRHIVSIFRAYRANNVQWVWAPASSQDGTVPIAQIYPGDAYVDWLGIDGYNWGSTVTWSAWRSFDQVFGPSLADFRAISPNKPVAISETSSAEMGGNKAAWISEFFTKLKANPQIRSYTWFNLDKETDWRITSSESARAAFASGLASMSF